MVDCHTYWPLKWTQNIWKNTLPFWSPVAMPPTALREPRSSSSSCASWTHLDTRFEQQELPNCLCKIFWVPIRNANSCRGTSKMYLCNCLTTLSSYTYATSKPFEFLYKNVPTPAPPLHNSASAKTLHLRACGTPQKTLWTQTKLGPGFTRFIRFTRFTPCALLSSRHFHWDAKRGETAGHITKRSTETYLCWQQKPNQYRQLQYPSVV